jgi:hypothetical protein
MRVEYVYEGHRFSEGTTPAGPFLCIIFEKVGEDEATEWSLKNDYGDVFPIIDNKNSRITWEVDCYNVELKDFIKVCWQAWCVDHELS